MTGRDGVKEQKTGWRGRYEKEEEGGRYKREAGRRGQWNFFSFLR